MVIETIIHKKLMTNQISEKLPIQSKQQITTISIIASGGLAIIKFVIGVLTGSLGLIAEGMHSLLDLLSTIVTFIAVRIGSKPPDANHPYGHERAESLGALAGMALLGATAVFILYHAIVKIVWEPGAPEVNIWSFAIIIISIVVDFLRVRSLKKAAKHYRSQALASDAEHFSNDMLGALSVLVGLIFILLSKYISLPIWLVERADAIAALGVVIIAFKSVVSIGGQALKSLMDDVPEDLAPRLQKLVEELPEVMPGTVNLRARVVGNKTYVEATVGTSRDLTFEKVHRLTEEIEKAIVDEFNGDAEVIVHPEPVVISNQPYSSKIRALAERLNLHIHNLNLYMVSDQMRIELDLELPESLSLFQAHEKSEMLEKELFEELGPSIKVAVHIEPRNEMLKPAIRREKYTKQIGDALSNILDYDHVLLEDVLLTDEGLVVTLVIGMEDDTPLSEAHLTMHNLERSLRKLIPNVLRVHIDPEPMSRYILIHNTDEEI
jgi:cation diffusion facilitator family transporter